MFVRQMANHRTDKARRRRLHGLQLANTLPFSKSVAKISPKEQPVRKSINGISKIKQDKFVLEVRGPWLPFAVAASEANPR